MLDWVLNGERRRRVSVLQLVVLLVFGLVVAFTSLMVPGGCSVLCEVRDGEGVCRVQRIRLLSTRNRDFAMSALAPASAQVVYKGRYRNRVPVVDLALADPPERLCRFEVPATEADRWNAWMGDQGDGEIQMPKVLTSGLEARSLLLVLLLAGVGTAAGSGLAIAVRLGFVGTRSAGAGRSSSAAAASTVYSPPAAPAPAVRPPPGPRVARAGVALSTSPAPPRVAEPKPAPAGPASGPALPPCPRCESKDWRPVARGPLQGARCQGCEGTWVDGARAHVFVETAVGVDPSLLPELAGHFAGERLGCPQCRLAMDPVTLKGVHIDRCGRCAGLWLDDSELEALTRGQLS